MHLRGDRIAEDGADGLEQVLADDGVVARLDAERHVLVRDALHHRAEVGSVGIDQVHRERDDGCRQRLRLIADRLIRSVEDPQQFGVGGEHRRVELTGDRLGVLGDDPGGGADDRFRLL